jgi:hypothetical protein
MRASTLLLILLFSAAANAPDLTGQWLQNRHSATQEMERPSYSLSIPQLDPQITAPPSWRSRILTGAGGALVGAFLGFFASEVVAGDWDVREGVKEEPHRPLWAAVGGSIGLTVGFKFPIHGNRSSPGSTGVFRSGRWTIIADEIEDASLGNAYDAVRLLRPEWFTQRGRDSFTEVGTDNIRVYLNMMELGALESLRQVESSMIEAIQFIGARRATLLFGAGHIHGVIQVVTLQ